MRGPSPHDPEGVFTRPRRPEWPEAPFLNDDVPAAPSAPVPGEVDERARVRLVVVMPVGPGEDLHDTLASVDAYTEASRAIVLVNDTGAGPPALRRRLTPRQASTWCPPRPGRPAAAGASG